MSRNKREGYYTGVSSGKFRREASSKWFHLISFPGRSLNRKQKKHVNQWYKELCKTYEPK